MYKIIFHLKSPVSFTHKPTFDGILAWCLMKEKYGDVPQPLSLESVEDFDDLPLLRHSDGYFMASWMQYDEKESVEFTGGWKKRWASEHDHLVDFKAKQRKVRINSGEFKSYDMPMVLHHIRRVWFFFDSEDLPRVEHLVSSHLWGIGKKSSRYGEIESFEIEPILHDPFEGKIIRPVPAKTEDIAGSLHVRLLAWKPPYWLPENQAYCVMPA